MSSSISQLIYLIGLIIQKRRTRWVFLVSSVLYLLLYLFAIGDLGFYGWQNEFAVQTSSQPFPMLFKQISPFYFEAIALVKVPLMSYLFSPLNLLFAIVLAVLVGLNIALSYIAIVQPKVCYGNPTLGVFSSLPALIAGSACCGPIILLVLGIQASAFLIALFGVLVPIAIMLLLGTLVLNGRRTNVHYLREL
jgi:hypothetical protein